MLTEGIVMSIAQTSRMGEVELIALMVVDDLD
jgi:hypothetical protein